MIKWPSFSFRDIVNVGNQQRITNWRDYLDKSREEFTEQYNREPCPAEVSLGEFDVVRTVGTGWYGRVVLAKNRISNTYHALKVFRKEVVVRLDQIQHVFSEKKILQACNFPFTLYLEYYFIDKCNVYFVMPFVVGGELFSLLKKRVRLEESWARFYSAQMIMALEYLHNVGVVYRDIKPENILINRDGYIKVTDFGFAKMLNGRTYTLCGTPDYFAPEMISSRGYGISVDWWALGVLIYEMCSGNTPFSAPGTTGRDDDLYRRILSGKYFLPMQFSSDLNDVLSSLFKVEPWRRPSGPRLRQFPWYRPINFLSLLNRDMPAPYVPYYTANHDTSNYDQFKEVPLIDPSDQDFSGVFADF